MLGILDEHFRMFAQGKHKFKVETFLIKFKYLWVLFSKHQLSASDNMVCRLCVCVKILMILFYHLQDNTQNYHIEDNLDRHEQQQGERERKLAHKFQFVYDENWGLHATRI